MNNLNDNIIFFLEEKIEETHNTTDIEIQKMLIEFEEEEFVASRDSLKFSTRRKQRVRLFLSGRDFISGWHGNRIVAIFIWHHRRR